MTHVGCPHCDVRYPVNRLDPGFNGRAAVGKTYTVVCSVCGERFDVAFRKRWFLPLRAHVRRVP